jgi:hypothetical protein
MGNYTSAGSQCITVAINNSVATMKNITISAALTLQVSTVTCSAAASTNGTIARNVTGLYYCNGNGTAVMIAAG